MFAVADFEFKGSYLFLSMVKTDYRLNSEDNGNFLVFCILQNVISIMVFVVADSEFFQLTFDSAYGFQDYRKNT